MILRLQKHLLFASVLLIGGSLLFASRLVQGKSTLPTPAAQSATASSFSIGDIDISVTAVRRIVPESYEVGDLWYGTREPWNSDGTRLMYWEDNNAPNLVHGQYGLGIVWARIADLRSWTTLAEYEAIRHPLNPFPYSYDGHMEWSPFVGEENIVYAARLFDNQLVKINVDTGMVEPILSLDPGRGSVIRPSLMRWTTDNALIVLLDGPDSWANGALEVDVRNRSARYYDPNVYPSYWDLAAADLRRWPYVLSHGHTALNPSRKMFADYYSDTPNLADWPSKTPFLALPLHGNYVSWRASNWWWLSTDFGLPFYEDGLTTPTLATFNIYQCWIYGRCRKIYQVVTAQDYNDGSSGYMNWPTAPLPTIKTDGRQMVFTSTDGKFSAYDFRVHGATPWGYRGLFLADLAPAPMAPRCSVILWDCQLF